MHTMLQRLHPTSFPAIQRSAVDTLQINLGYRCNQSCLHCHVNAGPNRTEMMERETIHEVLAALEACNIQTLDLTGGAPELNPHFRDLVRQARSLDVHVIDRCNLTILLQPGMEDLADFLADNKVEIVASLPCYLKENVDSQRGKGVHQESIQALQKLNRLGYGMPGSNLTLNLVYNPGGPYLPPEQTQLEADYKRELKQRFSVEFNQLLALTNLPIQRFGSTLVSKGQFADYMKLLKSSHRDYNLGSVMCKRLVSVDWQGKIYDCDFNQMLGLPLVLSDGRSAQISDLEKLIHENLNISVADHCYGCTAGQGSSCGGALV
ncbi:MAG TPA: radical SAM/Cys-rich domain protein [Chromatiales bacterium]|nr:radical SAM/Cys-rich domain protein [Thiotrichales bacterium]HIP67493.1 radical SAM/Cys-rich domain protein [Chromatiales bacterium]